mmetsp:Transcript_71733/g.226686  ORF Transcript_71733/g.226686 Transcript_71733/m.226686 type:complete len:374 (+) Transcript_71733:1363-2484(+)
MLGLPLLFLALEVLREFLIALHLHQHLLLEGLLKLLGLLRMGVLQIADGLFTLGLTLCLLLTEDLELPTLRLNLLAVLLLEFRHLLPVEAVAVPELEVYAAAQLLYLALQVEERRLLVVKEGARHEDLVGEAQAARALAAAPRGRAAAQLEDEEAAVVAAAEGVLLVVGHAEARDRRAVRLVLRVVALQGQAVEAQGPRQPRLRDAREERPGARRERQLPQDAAGLQVVGELRALNLFEHAVRTHKIHGIGLRGGVSASVGHDAGEARALLRPAGAAPVLLDDVKLARCPVRPRGDDARVVGRPADGANLGLMAPEVAYHLAGVGPVDLDGVRVHGREELAAVAEAALPARLDRDLLVVPHVRHEQVHEPELV